MNDRDIEDTRTPPEQGEDVDALWNEVSDVLPKRLMEFVNDECNERERRVAHWQQQSRATNAKLERIKKMIEGAYEVPTCAANGVEELAFDEMEVELSKALHLIEELYDVLNPNTGTA